MSLFVEVRCLECSSNTLDLKSLHQHLIFKMLCNKDEKLTIFCCCFFFFLLGFLIAQDASERAALLHSGVLSDGQFYSPPESVAGRSLCMVNDFLGLYLRENPAYFAPFRE